SQALQAAYPQVRIDDSHLVRAHLARADGVPDRAGCAAHIVGQLIASPGRRSRPDFSRSHFLEGLALSDGAAFDDGLQRKLQVLGIGQVAWVNVGIVERARGSESDFASTLRA